VQTTVLSAKLQINVRLVCKNWLNKTQLLSF